MSWKNSNAGYGSLSITLHWLMLALLVAVYCTMEFKGIYKKGTPGRDAIMMWHYMLGLTAFFLVWLRVLTRLAGTRPAIEPALPDWQAALAKAGHWALYALMIGLPVLGWLTLSAKGSEIPFFGVELPPLIGKSEPLAKTLKAVHEWIAKAGYFVIGLHAAAALYHHYVRRDNTLRLMLPGKRG